MNAKAVPHSCLLHDSVEEQRRDPASMRSRRCCGFDAFFLTPLDPPQHHHQHHPQLSLPRVPLICKQCTGDGWRLLYERKGSSGRARSQRVDGSARSGGAGEGRACDGEAK